MSHRLPVADIQFISDFAAYARKRGAKVRYDFRDQRNCACAQFLRASGRAKTPWVGGFSWRDDHGCGHAFPSGLDDAIIGYGLMVPDKARWTFSALADRLEALIADAPEVERV